MAVDLQLVEARCRDISRTLQPWETNPPLSPSARDMMRLVAREYGLDDGAVSDADLATLYRTANKNAQAGVLVAGRIRGKLGAKSQFDPLAPYAPPAPPGESVDLEPLWKAIGEVVARANASDAVMLEKLASAVQDAKHAGEQAVQDAINRFKASEPVTLQVVRPESTVPVALGKVHRRTPDILKVLMTGRNVYLHGPAGSGKTTAAAKCAEALGVQFYFAAKVSDEFLLIGYNDAHGNTVRTQFREAYEHGGVFLFDEMDASASGAIVALNAALANGICPFPDGIVKRHKDFYCIGAGNTVLTGANRQYAGRTQLDGASIDRFVFIEFAYDEALERDLASNSGWCYNVQALRKAVADRGLNHLITPRATLDGCALLEAGFDWQQVEDMCVFKGLDADTVSQLRQAINVL